MSLSYYEFTCSRCAFQGDDTVLWGRMSYQAPGDLIPVQRELGWCVACGGLAPIEVLPSQERLLGIATKEYRSPWPAPLTGEAPTSKQLAFEAEYSRLAREHDLLDERARLDALAGRSSAPRCLECGSVEVFALPEDIVPAGVWHQPEPPVPVGIEHPGCGGELMVRHSDIRISMSIPERMYTVEGLRAPGPEVEDAGVGSCQPRLFD